MDRFFEILAERYFCEHRADFGEKAIFDRFIVAEGSLGEENAYPTTVFGYLAYQVGDEVRVSSRMRIHYLTCDPKTAQSTPSQWFAREASFYGLIWPHMCSPTDPQLVPKFCSSTAYWRPGNMVAANLFESARGYLTWGYTRCLDLDHLTLMVRKIAQFHGCALRHKAAGEPLMKEQSALQELYSAENCRLVQPTLQRCLQPLYSDPLYTTESAFAPGVAKLAAKISRLEECMAALTEGMRRCQILCHMNYSQASVFFKYEGSNLVNAMIGNWATADYCSLGADLVILLFVEADMSVSMETRRKLMFLYHEELKRFCPQEHLPPMRDVMLEIKRCAPITLFALGARVAGLSLAPCLAMRTTVSKHWNDEFATNVFKTLILNGYMLSN